MSAIGTEFSYTQFNVTKTGDTVQTLSATSFSLSSKISFSADTRDNFRTLLNQLPGKETSYVLDDGVRSFA